MPNPKPFVAAAVQAAPVYCDIDATVDKTIDLIGEAASNGAKLVVFPETFIPGYPYWAWLAAPAWGVENWVQRYFENGFEIGSTHEERIAAAARENGIHVILGISERAGGSLYMGQLLLDDRGERIAARRKLKPTYAERFVFGEGGGSDIAVHETDIGRVGALCCWEHFQPLTKFAMFSQNEQIHAASWPTFTLYPQAYGFSAELNDAASSVYAGEGGCFVLTASMPMNEEILDMICDTPDKRELITLGGGKSMIFSPEGQRLAEYIDEKEEGIVYAEIDLSLIAIAKAPADPAGHYARPDVTKLVFNQAPRNPVESPPLPPADGATTTVAEQAFEPAVAAKVDGGVES